MWRRPRFDAAVLLLTWILLQIGASLHDCFDHEPDADRARAEAGFDEDGPCEGCVEQVAEPPCHDPGHQHLSRHHHHVGLERAQFCPLCASLSLRTLPPAGAALAPLVRVASAPVSARAVHPFSFTPSVSARGPPVVVTI